MMLHRMKYLLKIPLLAISMACNRSAQEIKMIVPQSPSPLLPSSEATPCTSLVLQTPVSAAITANICSLFPWHHLSMTTVARGGYGVCVYVCWGVAMVWGWSNLNYRHSKAGENTPPDNYAVRDVDDSGVAVDCLRRTLKSNHRRVKKYGCLVFVPNSCQVVQGSSNVWKQCY